VVTLRISVVTLCALVVFLGSECNRGYAQERTDFPTAARERYDQGKDLQKKGQLDAAIRAFEEAIDLGMQAFPRVHLSRAASNLDLKKYDSAIAQYTHFIEQFGLEKSCRY
jgi:outer membrane protein assembly factor BamD (BamD/ComL family)